MRIAWERSVKEDHDGPNLLVALSCAERAAPYMHPKVGPVDEKARVSLMQGRIRVVVQRLTPPMNVIQGGGPVIDGAPEPGPAPRHAGKPVPED